MDISKIYKFSNQVEHVKEIKSEAVFSNIDVELCKITNCEILNEETKSLSKYVTFAEDEGWKIISSGNIAKGYNKELVLRCYVHDGATTYSFDSKTFRIIQTRDCSSCLVPKKIELIKIDYSPSPSSKTILNSYTDAFDHEYPKECLVKRCYLSDCNGKEAAASSNIQIKPESGQVSANTASASGYFQSACVNCLIQSLYQNDEEYESFQNQI